MDQSPGRQSGLTLADRTVAVRVLVYASTASIASPPVLGAESMAWGTGATPNSRQLTRQRAWAVGTARIHFLQASWLAWKRGFLHLRSSREIVGVALATRGAHHPTLRRPLRIHPDIPMPKALNSIARRRVAHAGGSPNIISIPRTGFHKISTQSRGAEQSRSQHFGATSIAKPRGH